MELIDNYPNKSYGTTLEIKSKISNKIVTEKFNNMEVKQGNLNPCFINALYIVLV